MSCDKETNNERCPRCGKNILVNDEDIGEVVCRTCSFLMSQKNTTMIMSTLTILGDTVNGFR